MLNSVLIVGVPMVALLAAAFYVFTRTQQQEPQSSQRQATGSSRRGNSRSSGRASSTNARRRYVHAGDGDGDHDDGTDVHASSSDSPDSGFGNEDQCEICFEGAGEKVKLYPCGHSDICRGCVIKLLLANKRLCPFCRGRINGYMETDSNDLFAYSPATPDHSVGAPLLR